MPNEESLARRLILSSIFSILIHENKLFCQIQYCASPAQSMPKTGLRAKRRFLGFARKTQPSVTGKTPISGICPQMLDPVPPKVDKNNALLSIFVYHRLKIRTPRLPKQTKNGLFCLILSTPAPTEPQADQTMLSTFLRPMQCNDIASTCSAFSMQKSGISASSAKIPH